MNVFVVGTGRCGTVTLSKSLRFATNYTVGHESNMRTRRPAARTLEFPANHIEVDAHLTFLLAPLLDRYPDALIVHLRRDRTEVVDSWVSRGRKGGAASMINAIWQQDSSRVKASEYFQQCQLLALSMVRMIDRMVPAKQLFQMDIAHASSTIAALWVRIGAEGDLAAAIEAARERHNRRGGKRADQPDN